MTGDLADFGEGIQARMEIVVHERFSEAIHSSKMAVLQVYANTMNGGVGDALRLFGQDLMEINSGGGNGFGPSVPDFVSKPIPTPGGWLMVVDFGRIPQSALSRVPTMMTRRLEKCSVSKAKVLLPPRMGSKYVRIDELRSAARAILCPCLAEPFGPAPRRPPVDLIDIALCWIRQQNLFPTSRLTCVVVPAEIPLTWDTAKPVCQVILESGVKALTLVSSDFATRVATALISGGLANATPRIVLTTAGATWSGADVAARMINQRQIIQSYRDTLAWAAVTAEPDARLARIDGWQEHPKDQHMGVVPWQLREVISDTLVPCGAWFQVLSQGHLAQLGSMPSGAVVVDDERVELDIGMPQQWLPGHPDRARIRTKAKKILSGCIATEESGSALVRQRMALVGFHAQNRA